MWSAFALEAKKGETLVERDRLSSEAAAALEANDGEPLAERYQMLPGGGSIGGRKGWNSGRKLWPKRVKLGSIDCCQKRQLH